MAISTGELAANLSGLSSKIDYAIFLHLFPESDKQLFDNPETLPHIETILSTLSDLREVRPINRGVLKISEQIVSQTEQTVHNWFSMLDERSYTDSAIKALEDLLVLSERQIFISKYVQMTSTEKSLITRLEKLDIRRLVDAIRNIYRLDKPKRSIDRYE